MASSDISLCNQQRQNTDQSAYQRDVTTCNVFFIHHLDRQFAAAGVILKISYLDSSKAKVVGTTLP